MIQGYNAKAMKAKHRASPARQGMLLEKSSWENLVCVCGKFWLDKGQVYEIGGGYLIFFSSLEEI